VPTIWIVNHYAGGPGIGTGWRHWELGRRWARQGVRVRIFTASTRIGGRQCPNRRGESVQDGVSFRFIPTREYQGNGIGRALNMAEFARGSVRAMREAASAGERPDVIIASSPQPFMWPGSARMARLLGAAFVPDIRDAWPESLRDLGGAGPLHPAVLCSEWALRAALRQAKLVISPLPMIHLHVADRGFRDLRCEHVPNGITPSMQEGAVVPPGAARAIDAARSQSRRIIMYAGAMGTPNALDELVNALKSVPEQVRERLLVLMIGDGTERRNLERSAAPLGASIRFLGEVEQEAVQAIGRCCDAGIVLRTNHPVYRFGTSPQKLAMYLACGLPVICATPEVEHAVGTEGLGWQVPPSDLSALRAALVSVAEAPTELLVGMGRRAAAHAAQRLDWEGISERCLVTVLGSGKVRPAAQDCASLA
jgi:glycosyltransferase involved in cell wall biosynthesis